MGKILQCPWFATNGLSKLCLKGYYQCNCYSCDCPDKRYVEIYSSSTTAGTSDWPNYLKEE